MKLYILKLLSKQKQEIFVDKYVVPELRSNTSEYGTCNNYQMTGSMSNGHYDFTNPWTMRFSESNYIPSGATVIFTIQTVNNYQVQGCTGCSITYTYTDDTTEVIFYENRTREFSDWIYRSGNHSATITLPVAGKTIKAISLEGYKSFGHGDNPIYNAWGITFRAQYSYFV